MVRALCGIQMTIIRHLQRLNRGEVLLKMIQELIQLKQPYFHMFGIEKSEFQKLLLTNGSLECEGMVVKKIEGSKCETLDGLFAEFTEVLQFPDYFGNNWAAFDECLNDLDWLPGEAYLLLIEDTDQVITTSDNSFKIFVETLMRSVDEWTEGRNFDDFPTPPTAFHVVFQCSVNEINDVKERLEEAGLKNFNFIST